jgi:hypothetical protein
MNITRYGLEKLSYYLDETCHRAGISSEYWQCGRSFFYFVLVVFSTMILALSIDTCMNMIRIGYKLLRIVACCTVLLIWMYAWSTIFSFVKEVYHPHLTTNQ